MKLLTYGVLPQRGDLLEAFNREIGEGETYDVKSGALHVDPWEGRWTAETLLDKLEDVVEMFKAGDLEIDGELMSGASCIMGHLGYEWV